MIHSQIGSLVDGGERVRVSRSQIGFALFGPYATLPTGEHQVEFEIVLESAGHLAPDDVICKLDVASGLGTEILARREVQAAQVAAGGAVKLALPFSLLADSQHMEFRVWSLGKADFAVTVERPVTVGAAGAKGLRRSGFRERHAEALRWLAVQGAEIVEHPDGALISLAGVNVMARHREDFQLISEVLVYNHYHIQPTRDSIAVDIGMNIGLASVFLAKRKWARKVYSFEPFREPFARSRETFACNPDVAEKIVARQAGLSDRNERIVVRYNPEETIATSVKGSTSGPAQTLEILDAGAIFQAICDEAAAAGLGVVVKLDCEGSEFPIMRRLAELDLIKRIDAFMIEWHKAWSPDVSLADLTGPLIAQNFVIFDHTVESDLHAGMLFAARAPAPA